MANALFPLWKQALLQGSANTALTGTLKVALVDTGVAAGQYNAATQYLSSMITAVPGNTTGTTTLISGIAPVGATSKTYTNGALIPNPTASTFTAVPAGTGTGTILEALVLFIDVSNNPALSPVVAFIDTGVTGLSGTGVTPNGGDITVNWNASGIFAL